MSFLITVNWKILSTQSRKAEFCMLHDVDVIHLSCLSELFDRNQNCAFVMDSTVERFFEKYNLF
jgi:hypothetical protein